MSLPKKNFTENQQRKRKKLHWRKFKIQWRRGAQIADFCPLSWLNVFPVLDYAINSLRML